jgi:hypothetical protein
LGVEIGAFEAFLRGGGDGEEERRRRGEEKGKNCEKKLS